MRILVAEDDERLRQHLVAALREISKNPSVIPLLRLPVLHRVLKRTGNPLVRSDPRLEAELNGLRAQGTA